jgi:hypothetical protein
MAKKKEDQIYWSVFLCHSCISFIQYINLEYNTSMRAYDVPLSALLYIVYAGVPEYDLKGPTGAQLEAYKAIMNQIIEDENDGL